MEFDRHFHSANQRRENYINVNSSLTALHREADSMLDSPGNVQSSV